MIAHARQILDPAATNQHHRVLLEVMTDTTNVSRDLHAVCQTNSGNLAQCGVRLLRCRGLDPVSYTHLRAHETRHDLVCRLLLEKKKKKKATKNNFDLD